MTSFIQTMLVPASPSLPSFSAFAKPLAPLPSLEQSESCIHLDIKGFAVTPAKRKHRTSEESVVEVLREALLNDSTPPAHRERARRRLGHPPSAWPIGSSSRPMPTRPIPQVPHKSPQRLRRYTVSDDEGYLCSSFPSNGICYCGKQTLTYCHCRNSRARGPFRPQKAAKGTSSWQLRQFAEATLGSGSLRKAVKLPEGEDANEWFAVNIVDFYNQINLLYGSITEFCSPQTCPEMKATDEFEYLWQDSENYKRPTKMSAPEYIEHLMSWCQANIDNESLFPSRIGVPFPKTFPNLLRQMFKRLYRVYAHIYCHHYPVVIQLGLEPHLNTSFKHYVLFVDEHQLASGKDFWGPLGELVESMLRSD